MDGSSDCPFGCGLLQHLVIPARLVVGMQQNVGVPFDQARQQRCTRQIDPIARPRSKILGLSRIQNHLAFHQNRPPLMHLFPIENAIRNEERLRVERCSDESEDESDQKAHGIGRLMIRGRIPIRVCYGKAMLPGTSYIRYPQLPFDRNMAYDIQQIRNAFPSLAETDEGVRRIYFDNPGGTQICKRSIDRMNDYLLRANTNTHGPFRTSHLTDAVIDETHAALADFVGADDPGEIIFGQNMTTITLHLSRSLAHTLGPDDEVVVTRMDHDANVSPWLLMARDVGATVRWIDFDPETYRYDESSVDAAITSKTKLVAVNYASNAIGTVNDVASVARKAHAVGALVFVDAVQYAPHFLTDVKAIECDFLACSPYKFYGPHQGMAWGRRELLESLSPYKVRPADDTLPSRWETGTQSHEGMAATLGAIEHFEWMGSTMGSGGATRRERIAAGFEVMVDYERELGRYLIEGLKAIPGVTIHGLTAAEDLGDRVPTIGMVKEGSDPDSLAQKLADANIFVWPGHYYAIEVIERLGLTEKGGMLRIGLGQYNTREEVDALLNVLD